VPGMNTAWKHKFSYLGESRLLDLHEDYQLLDFAQSAQPPNSHLKRLLCGLCGSRWVYIYMCVCVCVCVCVWSYACDSFLFVTRCFSVVSCSGLLLTYTHINTHPHPHSHSHTHTEADGFVLMYDMTNAHTFEEVASIRGFIQRTREKRYFPLILVGNVREQTLRDRRLRQVNPHDLETRAIEYRAPWFELSACPHRGGPSGQATGGCERAAQHVDDDAAYDALRARLVCVSESVCMWR
jgi:Ras family